MPPLNAMLLACATLSTLGLIATADRPDAVAGESAQLRPGAVKELAAGKLLVAARGLPDSNFSETVILLAEHGAEGSMGLVVNRRSEVSLARLFPSLKQTRAQFSALFVGGPVSPDGVLALLHSTTPPSDSRRVLDDIQVIATREGLEAQIAAGVDPNRFRVYLGYAGWGPDQLQRETLHGSWHVFRGDAALVFDPDPETVWQRQIRRTEERMALALP
jgi:putative transcriptional regulator